MFDKVQIVETRVPVTVETLEQVIAALGMYKYSIGFLQEA
ncbi:hypothetical protein NIES2135_61440 (plasmid) [Leptolyngbya boryana NIES-2135]|jgi:hypothetical protein|uniref:Uncharacterized protein n=1 Tax=Leptolyngbya boryana NIES-2135 TaxID=1973484 RepID=A0A1Z4JRH6_LEPBY|nr:hypothetical protein NIES2135_61440 [Leptolyngbya boryana NIES-2135]